MWSVREPTLRQTGASADRHRARLWLQDEAVLNRQSKRLYEKHPSVSSRHCCQLHAAQSLGGRSPPGPAPRSCAWLQLLVLQAQAASCLCGASPRILKLLTVRLSACTLGCRQLWGSESLTYPALHPDPHRPHRPALYALPPPQHRARDR